VERVRRLNVKHVPVDWEVDVGSGGAVEEDGRSNVESPQPVINIWSVLADTSASGLAALAAVEDV